MFDKEYSFKGPHADKVNKLTAKFDDKNQFFKRNYDVYYMAPIVGFLYQRKAKPDNGDGSIKPTKIFSEILINNQDDLIMNYRLIMLLDKHNAPDIETRVDKAFRLFNSDAAAPDEELYDQYVLGGVDVLYEKLVENVRSSEDYLRNLYDFLEEIDDRYYQSIDTNQIDELCKLAKR